MVKKNIDTDRRLSVEQAMHWLLAISMSKNIVVIDTAHQVAMIQEQHTEHFTSVSLANPQSRMPIWFATRNTSCLSMRFKGQEGQLIHGAS